MSSEGRQHGARQPYSELGLHHEHGDKAGRAAGMAIEHAMLPYHVDKLNLVVNERAGKGQIKGYDGHCKATGEAISRTFLVTEQDVKDKDGNVIRTDTHTQVVPPAYRDKDAR